MTTLFSRNVFIESFSDAPKSYLGLDALFPKLVRFVALHHFYWNLLKPLLTVFRKIIAIFQLKFFQGQLVTFLVFTSHQNTLNLKNFSSSSSFDIHPFPKYMKILKSFTHSVRQAEFKILGSFCSHMSG